MLNNYWGKYLSVFGVFPDLAGEIYVIHDVVVNEVIFGQVHLWFCNKHLCIVIYRLKCIDDLRVRSMKYYKDIFLQLKGVRVKIGFQSMI